MNIIELLNNAFPQEDEELVIVEKYSSVEVKYKVAFEDARLSIDSIEAIDKNIPENDVLNLSIKVGDNDSVSLTRNKLINDFVRELEQEREYYEKEDEVILLLNIHKTIPENSINIYNLKSFESFVSSLDALSFLDIINSDLKKNHALRFNLLEDVTKHLSSKRIIISSNQEVEFTPVNFKIKELRDHCHFADIDKYPYSPDYFAITSSQERCPITEKLEILSGLFSITGIFDITSIINNCLYYKLNGYKTFERNVEIDLEQLQSIGIYTKIYDWVYSESSGIADKLGLVRNILSIYLKDNSLEITDSAYFSIQSGFKTYLQSKLNKYIEIRDKISNQLIDITQKANSVIESYLSNYQKSNFTFISFFISVFIIRVLSKGDTSAVFSKEATIISFALLGLSILYLIFSLWNLDQEKKRLSIRYSNLKNRFKDLLIEEDINKILRDDKEYNDEVVFFNKRRNTYTILWVVTVCIFLIAILSISSYFNWNSISKGASELFSFIRLFPIFQPQV